MVEFRTFNRYPTYKEGKVFLITLANEIIGFNILDPETNFLEREVVAWYAASPPDTPWKAPITIELSHREQSNFSTILTAHRQEVFSDHNPYGLYQGKFISVYNFGAVCSRLGILPVVDQEGRFRDVSFLQKLLKEKKLKKLFAEFKEQYGLVFPPLDVGGEQITL